MNILLDTHMAIWAISNHPNLSQKARAMISDPDNTIYFSSVSVWEVLLKHSNAAVEAAKEVKQGNIVQQAALGETIHSISGMISDINETGEGVWQISQGADTCASSKNTVVDSMSTLLSISEENAASSEETGTSMEELSNTVMTLVDYAGDLRDISKKLNDEMEFFKG